MSLGSELYKKILGFETIPDTNFAARFGHIGNSSLIISILFLKSYCINGKCFSGDIFIYSYPELIKKLKNVYSYIILAK